MRIFLISFLGMLTVQFQPAFCADQNAEFLAHVAADERAFREAEVNRNRAAQAIFILLKNHTYDKEILREGMFTSDTKEINFIADKVFDRLATIDDLDGVKALLAVKGVSTNLEILSSHASKDCAPHVTRYIYEKLHQSALAKSDTKSKFSDLRSLSEYLEKERASRNELMSGVQEKMKNEKGIDRMLSETKIADCKLTNTIMASFDDILKNDLRDLEKKHDSIVAKQEIRSLKEESNEKNLSVTKKRTGEHTHGEGVR